jgi:hypothetical protein
MEEGEEVEEEEEDEEDVGLEVVSTADAKTTGLSCISLLIKE